jgi:hypothetical protein
LPNQLKIHQQAAQIGFGATRAPRHDSQSAMRATEHIEYQTGFAKRIAVQHKSDLVLLFVMPTGCCHSFFKLVRNTQALGSKACVLLCLLFVTQSS